MKANYEALIKRLLEGEDIQTYSFSQIEEIISSPIPSDYIKRKTFKWKSVSRFQMSAINAGFLLTDVDYENKTLTFRKDDGSIEKETSSNRIDHRPYKPVATAISLSALDDDDIGKDLDSAIIYFKNHWRSIGPNPQYVPFKDKYATIEEVYYHAGNEAYRASVSNRIPLFEGLNNRDKAALRERSVRYLASRLEELFLMEEMNFDIFASWEKEVATYIRRMYHDAGVRLYTYGNAQKLINVALKFVLSSNIVDYHHEVFKYCFFPIDGIIQRMLKNDLAVDFLHENGKRRYYQPSWARCDNFEDILDYQRRVRTALLALGYYSPLVWEATHWE